jgi:hypothetical protein
MTECNKISGMLVDYVNRKLQEDENAQVINHLAHCVCCRKEAADYIALKKLALEDMSPIPQDILDSAFNRIHQEKDILNSFKVAFETVKYSILIFEQTLSLAAKVM